MPAFIDLPDHEISSWAFPVAGWVAAPNPEFTLQVNGHALTPALFERPDVKIALARHGYQGFSTGFHVSVNVLDVLRPQNVAARRQPIGIKVVVGDEVAARQTAVSEELWRGLGEQFAIREETLAWCTERLRCPACRNRGTLSSIWPKPIRCRACGMEISQPEGAIDMLPATLRLEANPKHATHISSNPYEQLAAELIEKTTASGGWVLDCGAGSRPERLRHVVNVEIEGYFSTDVLAIGESLPFDDGAFDAAVSLAVLEHVRDPFACARELVRVVKGGGEIICSVPFLQPVHGYPDHYYNMTRSGLINLFEGLGEVMHCFTPPNGHPLFAVQWILREYLGGLPENQRQRFGAMTIAEAATLDPGAMLADEIATRLQEPATGVIACLNTLKLRTANPPNATPNN